MTLIILILVGVTLLTIGAVSDMARGDRHRKKVREFDTWEAFLKSEQERKNDE